MLPTLVSSRFRKLMLINSRIFHDAQGDAAVNRLAVCKFSESTEAKEHTLHHDSEAKEYKDAKDSEAREQKSRGSMLPTISFCPIRSVMNDK